MKETILIVNPASVPIEAETLSASHVPLEALKANMGAVLRQISAVFSEAKNTLGSCKLEYADVSLVINVDGSVGILGTGLQTGIEGGVTLRLKFD